MCIRDRDSITPKIFTNGATSWYNQIENKNGIRSDNLLATEATASPLFCTVSAMRLKILTNERPIKIAHLNQGCCTLSAKSGHDMVKTTPVRAQER